MLEVVVAAGADDRALGQRVAQALQRRFRQRKNEQRLVEQPALARLAHKGVQVAAPGRGQDHVGLQGLQARNLGREVGGAEGREKLGHDLDIGALRLQGGLEDFPAVPAPGIVLVDDGQGLELGMVLQQVG